ncbi:hypothetical protein, partial [Acinetobacter indicus]|uniref:hypothetical protein n=1 Tax=Acinetobacter indicus TaxID=756892 RepID=UPI0039895722
SSFGNYIAEGVLKNSFVQQSPYKLNINCLLRKPNNFFFVENLERINPLFKDERSEIFLILRGFVAQTF